MKCLQDYLSFQAQRRPEACAVIFEGQTTTYGEMEKASNRLARALRAAGCKRGDRVALLLPKSTPALIGVFAALKADCVYVPLDIASPPARLARMLQASDSRCLLANSSTAALLNEAASQMSGTALPHVGWMDGGATLKAGMIAEFYWGDVLRLSASHTEAANQDTDPAHILFTSGSTGVPKGVVITHSNVIHFVEWAVRHFDIGMSDRISCHPPLHFDLSSFDIHGTFAAGGQVHLIPPVLSLLPHRLAALIRESELTQWFSVPSVLNHLAKFDAIRWHDFPSLRRLLWCGEKFPTPALIYCMRRLPHVEFFNLYGPTETTIASSCYRVPGCPETDTVEIPIGDACQGEGLMVLNQQMRPVGAGETGDLYIGGAGLSPGYWRDPERTRAVFLDNPDVSSPFHRIYKTGDLARVGDDGCIYLLGRSDSQIKSRGYRIELGEIESAAHASSGVQEAAVVAMDVSGVDGAVICCAYVPCTGWNVPPLSLRQHMAEVLPHYMLPSHWMVLDRMPRNGNGKVDRASLKEQFRHVTIPGGVVTDRQGTSEAAHVA